MSYAVWDSPCRLVLLAWEMPLRQRLLRLIGSTVLPCEEQSLVVFEVGAGNAQYNNWFETVA